VALTFDLQVLQVLQVLRVLQVLPVLTGSQNQQHPENQLVDGTSDPDMIWGLLSLYARRRVPR
jgi:hypothetical protein